MMKDTKKGFTLIELLILVTVIALLVAILLSTAITKARNKSAVNAYKTEMQSVRRAVELCVGTSGGTVTAGYAENAICSGVNESVFPVLPKKCGGANPEFYPITASSTITPDTKDWTITTRDNGDLWGCKGCRLACTVEGCAEIEEDAGDCF